MMIQTTGLGQVSELQCQQPGDILAIEVTEAVAADELSMLENLDWWKQLDREGGVTTFVSSQYRPSSRNSARVTRQLPHRVLSRSLPTAPT